MGRFQSGQMGQTVNLLALRLPRFESLPTHHKERTPKGVRFSLMDIESKFGSRHCFLLFGFDYTFLLHYEQRDFERLSHESGVEP